MHAFCVMLYFDYWELIFKPEVRVQFMKAIVIVHVMADVHKLNVRYLEHRRWTRCNGG